MEQNGIVNLSNKILELIKESEMPNVHAILALESVKLMLSEQFVKDTMDDYKQQKQGFPGIN